MSLSKPTLSLDVSPGRYVLFRGSTTSTTNCTGSYVQGKAWLPLSEDDGRRPWKLELFAMSAEGLKGNPLRLSPVYFTCRAGVLLQLKLVNMYTVHSISLYCLVLQVKLAMFA